LTPEGKTKDEIGPWRTVVAGGVAGVTLWSIIFPADVVKSRLQVTTNGICDESTNLMCITPGVGLDYPDAGNDERHLASGGLQVRYIY
jgi:hypothetical protein